jgi:integrase
LKKGFWEAVSKAKLTRRGPNGKKERFRFHDLRHTFGSRLGMNGYDLKTIMEIMGHKTVTVAMRYQHPTADHKMSAVRSLDKIGGEVVPKLVPAKESNRKVA